MPRQTAYSGQRTTVGDLNEASEQVVQDYETVGDRNAAFGEEPIPDTIITTVGAPVSEARRWERRNAADTDWEEAFLPPALNGGWDSHEVVTNRSNDVTVFAEFVLNQAVPVTSSEYKVKWRTVDGTATVAENDYEAAMGEISLSPGISTASVSVVVKGKGSTPGPPETFYLELYDPSEGNLTFALGTRMRVDLTGDTSPLTLTMADGSGNEGDKITNRVTASREATGNITFEYSTAVGLTNPAPNSVYTQISGATGTIPEGNTFVDLTNQSNQVNTNVFIADETYRVVINPLTLRVDGGDVFALTGHDLTAVNTITRDQVVTPNIRPNFPTNARNGIYVAVAGASTTLNGVAYAGRARQPSPWTETAGVTNAFNANTYPFLYLSGSLSAASVVDASFTVQVRYLYFTEDQSPFSRTLRIGILGLRTANVAVPRGATTWSAVIPNLRPYLSDRAVWDATQPSWPFPDRAYRSVYTRNTWDRLLFQATGTSTASGARRAQIRFQNPLGLMLSSTAWQTLAW